jgi:hypothetical protein
LIRVRRHVDENRSSGRRERRRVHRRLVAQHCKLGARRSGQRGTGARAVSERRVERHGRAASRRRREAPRSQSLALASSRTPVSRAQPAAEAAASAAALTLAVQDVAPTTTRRHERSAKKKRAPATAYEATKATKARAHQRSAKASRRRAKPSSSDISGDRVRVALRARLVAPRPFSIRQVIADALRGRG